MKKAGGKSPRPTASSCKRLWSVHLGRGSTLGDEPDLDTAVAGSCCGVSAGVKGLGRGCAAHGDARSVDATLTDEIVTNRFRAPAGQHLGHPLAGIGMADDDDAAARVARQTGGNVIKAGLVDVVQAGQVAREPAG